MSTHVKARRAHSMPSRYVLPSLHMGEYEVLENREGKETTRLTRAKKTSLPTRIRKPKVYSSYNFVPEEPVTTTTLRRSESITRKSSNDSKSSTITRKPSLPRSTTTTTRSTTPSRPSIASRPSTTRTTTSISTTRKPSSNDYIVEESYRYSYEGSDSRPMRSRISLQSMRKPQFEPWTDNLLGLSSKMWQDTRKRQENFLNMTGRFIREDFDNARGTYVI